MIGVDTVTIFKSDWCTIKKVTTEVMVYYTIEDYWGCTNSSGSLDDAINESREPEIIRIEINKSKRENEHNRQTK